MSSLDIFKKRRTIHLFNNQIVSENIINKALISANYAPNHRLTFPWRFTLIYGDLRKKIANFAVSLKFPNSSVDDRSKLKYMKKFTNPSHLLIASQILASDFDQKMEDYASCACAIQNLCLSLTSDGVGSKWSSGKITKNKKIYEMLKIDKNIEEIIGFIWIGYGLIPPPINRPKISEITRVLNE